MDWEQKENERQEAIMLLAFIITAINHSYNNTLIIIPLH